jgi:hypothetical protein
LSNALSAYDAESIDCLSGGFFSVVSFCGDPCFDSKNIFAKKIAKKLAIIA